VGQAENRGITKLAIHFKEVQDLRLAVELTPLTGEPGPEFLETKITPLAQW
jgi:hypothetical protein